MFCVEMLGEHDNKVKHLIYPWRGAKRNGCFHRLSPLYKIGGSACGYHFSGFRYLKGLGFNFLKYFKRPRVWKLLIFCLVKGLTESNAFIEITSGVTLPPDYFLIT